MKELVLVGAGHAHLEVLRQFCRRPPPGASITLVSPDRYLYFAPMFSAVVAGLYRSDAIRIDMLEWARRVNARFLPSAVESLDLPAHTLHLVGGEKVPFDILSLNSGLLPRQQGIPHISRHVVPVRPFSQFLKQWDVVRQEVAETKGRFRIAVVGGGLGGVELVLALQYRLRQDLLARGDHPSRLEWMLLTEGPEILLELPVSARQRFVRILHQRGIRILVKHAVMEIRSDSLLAKHQPEINADAILWAVTPEGPEWITRSSLVVDERGCVRVGPDLQSVSHHGVFVAGDLAALPKVVSKSVVYPVQQGGVLAKNLLAAVLEKTPYHYRPRAPRVKRIATGDRNAIAVFGGVAVEGGWVWRLKDLLDRRFLRRYRSIKTSR